MMKSRYFAGARWTAAAVILCLCCAPAFANSDPTPSEIDGWSTAVMQTEGEWAGSYKYTINIVWSDGISGGMSHWDLLLKPGCWTSDHEIEFDTSVQGYSENGLPPPNEASSYWPPVWDEDDPPGFSPPEPSPGWDTTWTDPTFHRGDGSPEDPPYVKFNRPSTVPDAAGYGTFWFYSNIMPETVVEESWLRIKTGNPDGPFPGNLSGAIPSCTVIPEPLTMVGVFMGVCGLAGYIRRKRRRA